MSRSTSGPSSSRGAAMDHKQGQGTSPSLRLSVDLPPVFNVRTDTAYILVPCSTTGLWFLWSSSVPFEPFFFWGGGYSQKQYPTLLLSPRLRLVIFFRPLLRARVVVWKGNGTSRLLPCAWTSPGPRARKGVRGEDDKKSVSSREKLEKDVTLAGAFFHPDFESWREVANALPLTEQRT